jgi:hypothetical protein
MRKFSGFLVDSRLVFANRNGFSTAAGKKLTFTNFKDTTSIFGREASISFKNDHDLRCFFTTLQALCVVDSGGNMFRSLASMDDSKKYNICYSSGIIDGAAARFNSFIDNTAKSFEGKANIAVVKELTRLGFPAAKIMYASKKVHDDESETGEFDGIVATSSHIFVVEAKLHAKVPDIALLKYKMELLKDPQYNLLDKHDPRLNFVIGILATSAASNSDLEVAARNSIEPVWLLAANGTDFSLDPFDSCPISNAPTPSASIQIYSCS